MALRRLADECKDGDVCPGVWGDDQHSDHAIVVGAVLDPSPVPLGHGETAVRLRMQTLRDAVARA